MWVIRFKDMSITQTASTSEQGAWNLLQRMNPVFAKKSIKELEELGYAAHKTRTRKE